MGSSVSVWSVLKIYYVIYKTNYGQFVKCFYKENVQRTNVIVVIIEKE